MHTFFHRRLAKICYQQLKNADMADDQRRIDLLLQVNNDRLQAPYQILVGFSARESDGECLSEYLLKDFTSNFLVSLTLSQKDPSPVSDTMRDGFLAILRALYQQNHPYLEDSNSKAPQF